MSTRETLRMSWWNVVLAVLSLVAAVVFAVLGRWLAAIVLAAVAVVVVVGAVYARSGRASDLTRLHAAEYVDERDRAIGMRAFAIVGVCALVIAMGAFVAAALLVEADHPMFWVAWAQMVLLTIAWAVANVVAVRTS